MNRFYLILALVVLVIIGMIVYSEVRTVDSEHIKSNPKENNIGSKGLELPPRFMNLLRQEMRQIEVGMCQILSSLVQGNLDETAKTAMQIHDSFILKQSLSKDELKDLVSLLPKRFVKIDREFHQMAMQMSEEAQKKNPMAVKEIYGQMIGTCISCHSQFAQSRFPGL